MIHLDLNGTAGGWFYLDVHQAEVRRGRRGDIFALSGTLGDGVHEGPVLVEIGAIVEITFVDFLEGGDLAWIIRLVGREVLEEAILQAVSTLLFCIDAGTNAVPVPRISGYGWGGKWFCMRPREYEEQLELPLLSAETDAGWGGRQAA